MLGLNVHYFIYIVQHGILIPFLEKQIWRTIYATHFFWRCICIITC